MRITEVPNFDVTQLGFAPGPPRTPGLHLSDIINSILKSLDPKKYDSGIVYPNEYRETGFAFERVLEEAFLARRIDIVRPGEFELGGIIGSPDGIDVDDWRLREFKCTWKSMREAPTHRKFWNYIVQMKAYCRMVGTDRARLDVLFINGDYSDGFVPTSRAWELEFTPRELEENWIMLVNHARAKGML